MHYLNNILEWKEEDVETYKEKFKNMCNYIESGIEEKERKIMQQEMIKPEIVSYLFKVPYAKNLITLQIMIYAKQQILLKKEEMIKKELNVPKPKKSWYKRLFS